MPPDQLAALEGGVSLSTDTAPCRRAHRRSLRARHAFNDHMLADIGLRRDARAPRGVRPHEPWFFAQHLR